MGWLSRLGSSPPAAPEPEEEATPTGVDRAAPGLQALFEGVRDDGSHTLLDLGPASGTNFRLYARYARRVRFADLLERLGRDAAVDDEPADARDRGDAVKDAVKGAEEAVKDGGGGEDGEEAGVDEAAEAARGLVERIPRFPDHGYDLVLGWDVLDRIGPAAREALVDTFEESTSPDVRIYLTVRTDDADEVAPLRFTILDDGQVRQEPRGPPRRAAPPLLPAEVERVLEPFRVRQAFVLRQGLREYVVGR